MKDGNSIMKGGSLILNDGNSIVKSGSLIAKDESLIWIAET